MRLMQPVWEKVKVDNNTIEAEDNYKSYQQNNYIFKRKKTVREKIR